LFYSDDPETSSSKGKKQNIPPVPEKPILPPNFSYRDRFGSFAKYVYSEQSRALCMRLNPRLKRAQVVLGAVIVFLDYRKAEHKNKLRVEEKALHKEKRESRAGGTFLLKKEKGKDDFVLPDPEEGD
jgi:hypothetical protein